jgi:hypothetical protein
MKILILTVCFLLGLTALAQQNSRNSSEDPNLKRGFDGASTFLDPTNPDCKRCLEILKSRQNFSRDMARTHSRPSLGIFNPNQPNNGSPTLQNPGVNTGK